MKKIFSLFSLIMIFFPLTIVSAQDNIDSLLRNSRMNIQKSTVQISQDSLHFKKASPQETPKAKAEQTKQSDLTPKSSDKVTDKISPEPEKQSDPAPKVPGKISGKITDGDDGSSLPGVSIAVQGSTIGTVSDMDGNFTLAVPPGKSLVFSYLGYKSQTVVVKENTPFLNISMAMDVVMLDEVVAIGYGTMKKSDLTGSIGSIKSEALKKAPAANITQALQGRAAGVTVNANSGQPGAAATVRIRGIGTLNNSNPIYVVDGIIVSDISFLNSNDIESTEVLKDASASAIYGSRGANGVVLITTKKGSEKEGKISLDAYFGVQNRWKKLDLMKSQEFARNLVILSMDQGQIDAFDNGKNFEGWLSEYRLGASHYPVIKSEENPDGFEYGKQETDWQDEVFTANAPVQSYNISFTGGDDKKQYALSIGYFDQEGTVIGSYYKRLTLRANTDYQVRKWLKIGETMSFMNSTSRNAPANNRSAGASVLTAALAMAPWDPTHYPAGSYNLNGDDISGRPAAASNFKNVTNPFSMLETIHPMDYNDRFVGDVHAVITPVEGLTLRSAASMDYDFQRKRTFSDQYEYSSYDKREKNTISSALLRYGTLIFENTATYAKTINKHSFSIMAGQTTEEWNYYKIENSGASILNPVRENWYLSQTTEDNTNPAVDEVDRTRMVSLLGRLYYNYADRYLLTVNFRADGSSKFPQHRWGYFPSAAFGWRVSSEEFMQNQNLFGNLKLRLGWGQLGNQASVGSGDFTQSINNTIYFSSYILGKDGNLARGASINTWVNLDGKWEVTEQWNAALDWAVLGNKLSGTIDFFRRDTKEMFLTVAAPAYIGNLFPTKANVGTVRNDGLELSIDYNAKFDNVNFTIGGNASFIQNKLVALNGGQKVYGDRVISDEGLALFTYYGYKYLGIYRSEDEIEEYLFKTTPETYQVGDAKYLDVNGDGKINDDDRVALGNPFPDFTYGLNLSVNWKNFDLSLFFQGVAGNEIYNAQRHQLEGPGNETVMSVDMRNMYSWATPGGTIPNPRNSVNFYTSSRFVEKGDYLRLKNLQLGYLVPASLTKKAQISRARFYISGSNLLTFTRYKGYDPEVGGDGSVDYGNYPQAQTIMVGVNLDF
jgi:TonB-linked SusC/RagA family outer membrane protein